MIKILWILVGLIIFNFLCIAQDNKETTSGKFSGYVIGEYYYNIDHNNHEIKDLHGFWFRRIYLTYDYNISTEFSTRLRLEMNNDGSYKSSSFMNAVLKDVYLQFKFGLQKAYFGIASPPTFIVIEKVWGYRIVEKTALDLQRMASSRDFGIGMAGQIDKAGVFQYHTMLANGSGNKQEIHKGKSFMTSFSFWPTQEIVLEVYGDYANRADLATTSISQAFLGYNSKNLHGGIQYSQQFITANDDTTDRVTLKILSAFLSGHITEKIKLLGRVDRMFQPNPIGDKVAYTPFNNTASFTEFIAGIDFIVNDSINLIPNVKFVLYDENKDGTTPGNDLYANMTIFWKLN